MSVSLFSLVLLAGAIQGVCLAILLLTRQTNQLANRVLGILILLISIQTVLVAFDNRDFFLRFPHLSRVGWLIPTLFGPLFYLFTQKLVSRHPHWHRRDWLHGLAFLLMLAYLLPYYLQSAEEKRAYLNNFEKSLQDDFGLSNSLLNLLHVMYLLLSIHLLREHEQRILDEFSEVEQIRLQWLRQFLWLTLAVIIIGFVAFYGRKWSIPVLSFIYPYQYFGVILLIYWVGYKALSQPAIFHNKQALITNTPHPPQTIPEPELATEPAPASPDKYRKSTLPNELAERYQAKLLAYMSTQQPYRNQTLTIHELADALGISKHHLSQILNERLGKNFYDFINEYRIAAVKQMLTDPAFRHLTTLGIAEEAGFNSKATFNAVFKKMTGITPSEYLKNPEKVV